MLPSPYAPGAPPPVLAGRRPQLESARADLAMVSTWARLVGRIRVDVGPRGMGKTSLLKAVRDDAAAAGFVLAWATARADESLVGALAADLQTGLDAIGVQTSRDRGLRDRLKALRLELGAGPAKPGVELDVSRTAADVGQAASAVLGGLLVTAARAARERGSAGLCLFVDEIQSASVADLRTLAYAWQELQAAAEGPAAVLFAAGLPNSPDVLTDAVTFSERFAYRPLERLDDAAAAEALVVPAEALAVRWDGALVDAVLRSAQGYPYYLQLYADAIWRIAAPAADDLLAMDHLEAAQRQIDHDVQTMFRARWAKASPGERRLLAAMADHGSDEVPRSALASALAVDSDALGVPRRRLIDKGLIEPAGRGVLRFTIPGFAAFVRSEVNDA